jgi:hypothetical protein
MFYPEVPGARFRQLRSVRLEHQLRARASLDRRSVRTEQGDPRQREGGGRSARMGAGDVGFVRNKPCFPLFTADVQMILELLEASALKLADSGPKISARRSTEEEGHAHRSRQFRHPPPLGSKPPTDALPSPWSRRSTRRRRFSAHTEPPAAGRRIRPAVTTSSPSLAIRRACPLDH